MRGEILGGFFFLLLAVLAVEEALKLPTGGWKSPAPGFLPLLVALFLGILSAVLLLRGLIQSGREGIPISSFGAARGKKRVFLTSLALIAFNGLLEKLGFLVATFLFMAFLLVWVSSRPWKVALGTTLFFSLTLYVFFVVLLKVPLPQGLLGF